MNKNKEVEYICIRQNIKKRVPPFLKISTLTTLYLIDSWARK